MKKISLPFLFTILCVMQLNAKEEKTYRAVITECGTVHQIPPESTDEEACDYLDMYSEQDCGEEGIK